MRRVTRCKSFGLLLVGVLLAACIREFPKGPNPMGLLGTSTPVSPPSKEVSEPVEITVEVQAVPSSTINPILPVSPTVTATAQSNPLPATPMPASAVLRTHYDISAVFDYASHHLQVKQRIDYVNRSAQTLFDLALVVDPSRFYNAFTLINLAWGDGEQIHPYLFREAQIYFLLREPLPPEEYVSLSIEYELQLPNTTRYAHTRPYPFGYNDEQANLGDWYPYVPPYDPEEGWIVHTPGSYGEHLLYDIADYAVEIELVGSFQDVVIAASAPDQGEGTIRRYNHPAARSFAWSASPYYRTESEIVEVSSGRLVEVVSYYLPMYQKPGRRVAQTTAQALAVYSELFSPYQRPMLSAVQAAFLDGMEYDGMYFISEDFYNWHNGTETDYLVAIAAHETAHQWWYAIVGSDPVLEPWLDEALSTYCEHIFFEKAYPNAIDWWWKYRVDYYQPKGFIDISTQNIEGDYRAYRDVVYLNGAHFFHELRSLLGHQVFFAFLRTYLESNAYEVASSEDFISLLEQISPVDITAVLTKYLRHYKP